MIPPYQTAVGVREAVVRTVDNPKNEPRNSRARTPHHLLKGDHTPNGLHFTIMHGGMPDIDPAQHKLAHPRHGEAAAGVHARGRSRATRWCRASAFVECGGNSAPLFSNEPIQAERAGAAWPRLVRGMDAACCSRRSLDEAGVDPKAKWIIAEGADSPHLTRSVPLAKVCGRRHGRDVPERRAHPARPGLSDAALAARLRRQHERQVPAPRPGHRSARR